MAYTYDPIFAQDPNNPNVVASNAAITIYDPADAGKAPIAITDPTGSPLPNPITVNSQGMGPAFQHATLDRVAWHGAGFVNYFTSYEGMKNEAKGAKEAAQAAANTATTAAAQTVTAAAVDGAGKLILTKADGGTVDAGNVKGAPGVPGPPGQPGSNVLPTAEAIAQAVTTDGPAKTALSATYAGAMLPIEKYRHLSGSFGENWAPAINAAIADAQNGETIDFRQNGGIAGYNITEGIVNTKNSIRFLGRPRDGYAMAIHCNVPGVTMLTLKSAGIVIEDIAFAGDSTVTNGAGATVTALDVYGDVDGNCDVNFRGVTFQGCKEAVRTRGRNVIFDGAQTLFSNCLDGVVADGPDAVYHTGPNATQNRGITLLKPRFHNIGTSSANACIKILPASRMLHCLIDTPYHDSLGKGKFLIAEGTVTYPIKAVTVITPKHTEIFDDAYDLTYVTNTKISGAHFNGVAGVGGSTGRAFVLNNCDTVKIHDVLGVQLGGAGIYARNCSRLDIKSVRFRAIGGHGFDIDGTNNQCSFDDLAVEGSPGWGFTGSPVNSKFGDTYEFRGCSLGGINSTTFIPDQVFVPAQSFTAVTGTPSLAGLPGVGYPITMQFDKDAVELATGEVGAPLPNTWETFDAYIVWAATDAQAGAVVWDLSYAFITEGALPNASNVGNPGAPVNSPSVAGRVNRYKIASGKARGTAPMVLRVDRNAAAAADTYQNDAALIGVQLVRAS